MLLVYFSRPAFFFPGSFTFIILFSSRSRRRLSPVLCLVSPPTSFNPEPVGWIHSVDVNPCVFLSISKTFSGSSQPWFPLRRQPLPPQRYPFLLVLSTHRRWGCVLTLAGSEGPPPAGAGPHPPPRYTEPPPPAGDSCPADLLYTMFISTGSSR